ncbi:MAG: cobalt ECF transporter T component CbiQ [Candidatus Riflebacteria bacterium]|nr:cobalt ECF transporter T component CbiQ [Candidatus Riflebacteria bacterium]
MSRLLADPYQPGSSLVHRWRPVPKVVGILALVALTAVLPTSAWPAYGGMGCGALFLVVLSGISPARVGWRLLALEPLALGVALLALFRPDGVNLFLTLAAKSTLCLTWILLLTATTPFSGILAALQWMRVPGLLVTTLGLAYRYLFVLAEEAERMSRARRSRTLSPGRWFTWGTAATVAGQLFLRTADRAERVCAAMTARGWKR